MVGAGTMVLASIMPVRALAQVSAALSGTVVDGAAGTPVAEAMVVLTALDPSIGDRPARRTTGRDGAYRFTGLHYGRYALAVERVGYRSATLEVTLERHEPVVLSVVLEPVPFPLDAMAPGRAAVRGPSLISSWSHVSPVAGLDGRAQAVRFRQLASLSTDVRQLSHEDLREANTLAEHDILRAFQRTPGVGTRDDYSADLWTRGASAGQTTVFFDGVSVIGGLHALGVLSGLNSDVLGIATFQPGVSAASVQGAGAGVVSVESRSWMDGGSATIGMSPVSARASATGRLSDDIGWTLGLRRSYVDVLSALVADVVPANGIPYAFGDVTGRLDARVGSGSRFEGSFFWQDDRVFGDVPGFAYGNHGAWGSIVARASFVTSFSEAVVRSTIGTSSFDASVLAAPSGGAERSPLHPATENRYRTLVAESRIDAAGGWSAGILAARERHEYNGPGIDLARLLSPEELSRRGIAELAPIIVDIERSRLLATNEMTRLAAWGERRMRLTDGIELDGGLRVEAGDRVAGSRVRFAPRLRARYRAPGSPIAVSAAYGRAWQYSQSVARTDVLRPGLRASEVLVQADAETPALRADLVTVGAEAWAGSTWLVGATGWLRESAGVLLPEPTPGVIDAPRLPVAATGHARGVELSVRRLEGRIRGFANYTRSWSRHRVGAREFDASEDRRHMANIGVVADVMPALMIGATLRAQSGAPYTRITLIDSDCMPSSLCQNPPPVLIGTPGGQRAPAWGSLDFMSEWTHAFDDWSISVYGQLRNATNRANAATYHSSCLCVSGEAARNADLHDRFDRGMPRLPILGLRARF
jgi:hypothetical protein